MYKLGVDWVTLTESTLNRGLGGQRVKLKVHIITLMASARATMTLRCSLRVI